MRKMSKRRAIKILKELREWLNSWDNNDHDEIDLAFKLAIIVLSARPGKGRK